MEHKKEMVSAGISARGTAMVARTLYLVAPPSVTSASAANGRVPSWMEPNSAEQDAPISVWWDYPPCQDPKPTDITATETNPAIGP